MNAGQTCVAPDYVLVDESRKQQFLTEMKTAFSHLYGKEIKKNPDFGRIVNERHMERLQKILEQDAKYLFCGGGADTLQRYIEPPFWISERIRMRRLCRKNCSVRYCRFCHTTSWKMQYVFVNKRAKPLALYLFTKKDLQKSSFWNGCLRAVCVSMIRSVI